MKIVVQDLGTELSQAISFNLNDRAILEGIYPFLIMIGNPSGTFYFTILKDSTQIFQQSFTSADLKNSLQTTNNNLYVYYPIFPNIKIKNGSYTLKLTASGYTKTSSSFIGWGQQHENIQNKMNYTPTKYSENSLTYRLKIRKEGIAA